MNDISCTHREYEWCEEKLVVRHEDPVSLNSMSVWSIAEHFTRHRDQRIAELRFEARGATPALGASGLWVGQVNWYNTNVIYLSLKNVVICDLNGANWAGLERLELDGCVVVEGGWPLDFSKYKNLRVLCLVNMGLHDVKQQVILPPSVITIDFRSNRLTHLRDVNFPWSVRKLYLADNQFSDSNEVNAIRLHSAPYRLCMARNQLTAIGNVAGDYACYCQNRIGNGGLLRMDRYVGRIDLRDNNITDITAWVAECNLRTADLQGNPIQHFVLGYKHVRRTDMKPTFIMDRKELDPGSRRMLDIYHTDGSNRRSRRFSRQQPGTRRYPRMWAIAVAVAIRSADKKAAVWNLPVELCRVVFLQYL